ncbi:MAG: exodeoxyribonuclease VII large subunit [Dehalococcoidia bacterium]|nr:exodeoxyribonuclease VII large subunit [Dehalococcoidia bacterium]
MGILAAKFEELRLRLEAEGLFDPTRKRPLPALSAHHRPRHLSDRRCAAGHPQCARPAVALATILLSPALVQGEQAAGQVTAALKRLAKGTSLDLAIVARGGGSAEDLSAFNDERVARAIYGFPVPVVLGVGHETDVTIADLVADLRAPTPSAAAERAVPDAAQMEQALRSIDRQMASVARGALAEQAGRVESQLRRIQYAAPDPVGLAIDVRSLVRDMQAGLERCCAADRAGFENVAARIDSLNPMATLARGFAIVQKELSGKKPVVNSARKVKPGDRLSVSVADGAFWAEVS